MDTPRDGAQFARAPHFEDLLTLCRALNAAGVHYLIIGGFAVILHGSARGTKDVDLLVDAASDNVDRIKQALAYLPDNAVAEIANHDVAHYQVVRVADEIVIDLMGKACGIDYAEAMAVGIEHEEIDGVRVPFASKELLIRMKQTMRPSDASDVLFLQALLEEERRGKRK